MSNVSKMSSGLSALVSPRVVLGVGLVALSSLFGGTGCTSYSLTGLYIEPSTGLTCVVPGVSAQFMAYGTFTEGGHATQTRDITGQVTWSTIIPAVATVNSSGLVEGVGGGTTSVLASTTGEFGYLQGVSSVQVAPGGCTASTTIVKPFSLSIIPGNQTLTDIGQTAQPLAIATYANGGRPTDLSQKVTWESSNPKVATVDRTGLITATGRGDAVITASARAADGTIVSATQTVHFASDAEDQ